MSLRIITNSVEIDREKTGNLQSVIVPVFFAGLFKGQLMWIIKKELDISLSDMSCFFTIYGIIYQ